MSSTNSLPISSNANLINTKATPASVKTGRIKLSGKIVMRVHPEGKPLPPSLLREATYDTYAKGVWRSVDSHFGHVFIGNDETADLLPKKDINYSVRIARTLVIALCAVRLAARRLSDYATSARSRCAQIASASPAANPSELRELRRGLRPRRRPLMQPPTDVDTNVPPSEETAITQIAQDLNVGHMPPDERMQAVVDYFHQNFKYSTELSRPQLAQPQRA